MTFVLDPVWPWSWIWEVLQQGGRANLLLALLASVLAIIVPILHFTQVSKNLRRTLFSALGITLFQLSRHSWSILYAQSEATAGAGWAFLFTLLLVIAFLTLVITPGLLCGFGAGVYLGTGNLSRLRFSVLLTLRLLAFMLTMIAILRPALGWLDREQSRSQLFVLLDLSRSMTVQDERGKKSRWDLALESLRAGDPALRRLRDEQQVDVKIFGFGDDLVEFDLDTPGEPKGKHTETGAALRSLFEKREPRLGLRGVLLISDGADNGGVPVLGEAGRWRSIGGPIHTFACGNPGTTPKQNDVAITSISTSPTPFVPIKGKMTIRLSVDARGYENSKARVRIFLEETNDKGETVDREAIAQDVTLPLTTGNDVTVTLDAPAKPGEVKVKAVVETPDPDDLPLNNTIETFVTVSKEGISVLVVDRQRAWEPQLICDALSQDPRIRVTPIWVRGGQPVGQAGKLLAVDSQPFDVVILGDVTIKQLRAVDPEAPEKIEKLVARGAGLLVLGGYVNLGNGDWKGSALEKVLPVDLTTSGQVEKPTRMIPTEDGLRRARYILRLDDKPEAVQAWEKLAKLSGFTTLTVNPERRGLATVLAAADTPTKEPLLIMQNYAGGKESKGATNLARVLVFAGDTTYRWIRNPESEQMHHRFWRQMVVWLAHQEDAQGSVWIRPDVRRLPVRSELGFAVGLRGKGGGPDIQDGKYEVEAQLPDGTLTKLPLQRSATENRGTLTVTRQPGIYRLKVRGEGKDPSGGVVNGEASARVIVYDEDLELARPAADPEFLRKLSVASSGEALRVEQLPDFLNRLAETPVETNRQRMLLSPNWRTTERSGFLVLFFVAFSLVVSLEWGLRRRWGLV